MLLPLQLSFGALKDQWWSHCFKTLNCLLISVNSSTFSHPEYSALYLMIIHSLSLLLGPSHIVAGFLVPVLQNSGTFFFHGHHLPTIKTFKHALKTHLFHKHYSLYQSTYSYQQLWLINLPAPSLLFVTWFLFVSFYFYLLFFVCIVVSPSVIHFLYLLLVLSTESILLHGCDDELYKPHFFIIIKQW